MSKKNVSQSLNGNVIAQDGEHDMSEDEEIFESVYIELEDYYDTVGHEVMFYDIKDDMTMMVINRLGMSDTDAYKFVCTWFDNRH